MLFRSWCVVAAREQGPDSGWAGAGGVIGAAGFVVVRVAGTVIAVALRAVGVVRAPDVLGGLPGPVEMNMAGIRRGGGGDGRRDDVDSPTAGECVAEAIRSEFKAPSECVK